MRRVLTIVIGVLAATLVTTGAAVAGGGGHGDAVCRGFGQGATIVMRDSCFEGIGHVVDDGTLRVENAGQLPHTLTAVDGSFDSGVIAAGETLEMTLDQTGAVPVYCTLHGTVDGDGMAGLLVIAGPDVVASSTTMGIEQPVADRRSALLLGGAVVAVGALIAWRRRRPVMG